MGIQYSHLNESRRMLIESLLPQDLSCRAIALQLGVATSTVTREVSRNKASLGPAQQSYLAVAVVRLTSTAEWLTPLAWSASMKASLKAACSVGTSGCWRL